ncbi:MAG: peptidylprolyl isomerase [Candidatus Marinimicrobia bacterium]|nr:peptidylprolyl isomerase [Candidatus Neomarinimicrobiota bacterium]MCF7850813.1 peptidylprolyl isomerase [Candidatus Neomarinimicrobiota bacterium]
MRRLLFLTITLLFIGGILSCSSEESTAANDPELVASINGEGISKTSFERAYLPVLLYGDKFDSPESRLEVLNLLIGARILATEARAAELDSSEYVKKETGRATRTALARKIYHERVKYQVDKPDEDELIQGFARSRTSLFVRHLYAQTRAEIESYAALIESGAESFYTIAQQTFTDSLLAASGGALGWITFGDLDETIEDTLYNLEPGRVSSPVKSQYGWHLLLIEDHQTDVALSEDEYLKNRDIIYQKIFERREELLAKQVLNEFMSQFEIEFNREVAKQVWPEVIALLNAGELEQVNRGELEVMDSPLDDLQSSTLLTVNDEDWTVGAILDRLPEMDPAQIMANPYIAASHVIRDEMLAREGQKKGYLTDQEVADEIRDAQDQLLAALYVEQFVDTMSFNEQRQREYFQVRKNKVYHGPDSLQIETYVFSDSVTASKALYRSRTAEDFLGVPENRIWFGSNDVEDPRYKLARKITVGTAAGPIEFQGEWTLVRLIERKRIKLTFEAARSRVAKDMENDRFGAVKYLLLKDIKPEYDIQIFNENL